MGGFEDISTNAEGARTSGGPKPPLDFSYHLSRVAKARQESKIKDFYKYFMIPGIGNLAGGESTCYICVNTTGSR